jgi:hypothetical protein
MPLPSSAPSSTRPPPPSSTTSTEVAAAFYFPDFSEIHPRCPLLLGPLWFWMPSHPYYPIGLLQLRLNGLDTGSDVRAVWCLVKPSHPTNISPVSLVIVTYESMSVAAPTASLGSISNVKVFCETRRGESASIFCLSSTSLNLATSS